jgi:hypothetical protein
VPHGRFLGCQSAHICMKHTYPCAQAYVVCTIAMQSNACILVYVHSCICDGDFETAFITVIQDARKMFCQSEHEKEWPCKDRFCHKGERDTHTHTQLDLSMGSIRCKAACRGLDSTHVVGKVFALALPLGVMCMGRQAEHDA